MNKLMSIQSEAKARQNYRQRPLSRRCRECENLKNARIHYSHGGWSEKLNCKIGGFAVKANAVCDLFTRKYDTK